jgi:methyl-accepting chemotaxis protein
MFKNLKISRKLALAFLIVIIFITAIGTLSLYKLKQVNSVAIGFEKSTMPTIEAIANIGMNFNSVRRLTLKAALASDAQEIADIKKQISESKSAVSAGIVNYEKIVSSEQEKKFVSKLVSLVDIYYDENTKAQAMISDSVADRKAIHDLLLGEGTRKFAAVTDVLGEMSDYSMKTTHASIISADSAYHDTIIMVSTAIVLSVLCAVALTIWVSKLITAPLSQAVAAASKIATGDLTSEIPVSSTDEPGQLLQSLEIMRQNLTVLVNSIRSSSNQVALAAGEIEYGNRDLGNRTESQASSLQQTAAAMEQFNSSIQNNAASVKRASLVAEIAANSANISQHSVSAVVEAMSKINSTAKKISEVLVVIDAIAFQTNLLALNAAVEAERAGESGRGFSVVATEVRSLASRCAESAQDIKELIAASETEIKNGVAVSGEANMYMLEVAKGINEVLELNQSINQSSAEQQLTIQQLTESVNHLDQVTQQNAALVEEMAAASASLKSQAEDLELNSHQFKI